MRRVRKIIRIDEELCDGCGQCVPSCAEGSIAIVDGKARLVAEQYCDGLGACLGECPQGALSIEERESEEFDEEAVAAYLEEKAGKEDAPQEPHACPSARLVTFAPGISKGAAETEGARGDSESKLGHWPVQIRLVPPTAAFLKDADLLVTADCVPVAYPNFHRDFLDGKVVMLGCPKFDNAEAYVEKFTDIFRTARIRTVTVLDMEVPCCSALPAIVRRAMEAAGAAVPMEEITIGTRGTILEREKPGAAFVTVP